MGRKKGRRDRIDAEIDMALEGQVKMGNVRVPVTVGDDEAMLVLDGDAALVLEIEAAIPEMVLRLRAKRSALPLPPPSFFERGQTGEIPGLGVIEGNEAEPTLSDAELFAEGFVTENAKTMYTEALVSGHPTPDTVGAVTFAQAMSPDAPTVVNEHGGKQSHLPFRFDLIDGAAMMRMAEVLDQGATKYGVDNWRLISIPEHLNHALAHIFAWLAGDRSDDHLSHALCRTTFAVAVDEQPGHAPLSPDDPKLAHLKVGDPDA